MKYRRISYLLFFSIILALELGLVLYLVLNKRMVLGHDGFELFAQQWFFVNSKVAHGQIPLWTPYMTQGNPAWWYFSFYYRIDIFTNILMLFSHWIKGIHFLPLFYGGLFFDKFILLAGVWLLAKRYFSSPLTVFFVASTVLASSITMTQNSFPLILCYGLPLVIYLLHRFFDTWNWKWLFFVIYFYSVISINTIYFLPITTLAVFLYFFIYYIGSFPVLIKNFKINKSDLIWVFLILILLSIFCLVLSLAKDPLMHVNAPYRQPDGSVDLMTFLQYGGQTNYTKWMELVIGISPNRDYTLYMGVLSLPLIFLGVFLSKNSNRWPLIVSAGFFLMFSQATVISVWAYDAWPLMKFYRHIGYISPLIKLYWCFLAGFGFEQLFDHQRIENPRSVLYKSLFSGFFLLIIVIFLDYLALKPERIFHLLREFCQPNQSIYMKFFPPYFCAMILNTAFLMLIGALIFFLRAFVKLSEKTFVFVTIVFLFHLTNVYGYAYQQIHLRSFPLTNEQYDLTKFQNIPFVPHRSLTQDYSLPREALVHSLKGIKLDSFNNFTFSDLIKPLYVSDVSLQPVHKLLLTFANNKISPVLLKLVGSSEEKVQFFTDAHLAVSDQAISSAMKDKRYAGDLLFYQSPREGSLRSQTDLQSMDLSQNQRIMIPYQVTSFSPNEIVIKVDALQHKGLWLEYCDAWHPFWKAQINGHPCSLYKGNLAYKALPLEQGMNTVRLYIEYKPLMLVYYFFMFSSFVWMIAIVCLLVF